MVKQLAWVSLLSLVCACGSSQLQMSSVASTPTAQKFCDQAQTAAQQHTIEVLKTRAQASTCIEALQKLSKVSELDLQNEKISDLSALESLTQLQHLYLSNNAISDLSPLHQMQQLKTLWVSKNALTSLD